MTLNQEHGSNADTSEADHVPSTTTKPPSAAPPHQVKRLREFIEATFPDASKPGEPIADTAIRLLSLVTVSRSEVEGALSSRCTEQYCNKPDGHQGEHGWVNYA